MITQIVVTSILMAAALATADLSRKKIVERARRKSQLNIIQELYDNDIKANLAQSDDTQNRGIADDEMLRKIKKYHKSSMRLVGSVSSLISAFKNKTDLKGAILKGNISRKNYRRISFVDRRISKKEHEKQWKLAALGLHSKMSGAYKRSITGITTKDITFEGITIGSKTFGAFEIKGKTFGGINKKLEALQKRKGASIKEIDNVFYPISFFVDNKCADLDEEDRRAEIIDYRTAISCPDDNSNIKNGFKAEINDYYGSNTNKHVLSKNYATKVVEMKTNDGKVFMVRDPSEDVLNRGKELLKEHLEAENEKYAFPIRVTEYEIGVGTGVVKEDGKTKIKNFNKKNVITSRSFNKENFKNY